MLLTNCTTTKSSLTHIPTVEDVAMLSQEDSQNEEEAGEMEEDDGYLNDLMAASSTIG